MLENIKERLKQTPDAMRFRCCTIEYPYGIIKAWMGATHFRSMGFERMTTEMSLHVRAYNLKQQIAPPTSRSTTRFSLSHIAFRPDFPDSETGSSFYIIGAKSGLSGTAQSKSLSLSGQPQGADRLLVVAKFTVLCGLNQFLTGLINSSHPASAPCARTRISSSQL